MRINYKVRSICGTGGHTAPTRFVPEKSGTNRSSQRVTAGEKGYSRDVKSSSCVSKTSVDNLVPDDDRSVVGTLDLVPSYLSINESHSPQSRISQPAPSPFTLLGYALRGLDLFCFSSCRSLRRVRTKRDSARTGARTRTSHFECPISSFLHACASRACNRRTRGTYL